MASLRVLKGSLAVATAWALTVIASQAQIFIEVGHYVNGNPDFTQPINLLPDTGGQEVDVFVQNTGSSAVDVAGLNFNFQVGQFNSLTLQPIAPAGPPITSAEILIGTVFAVNNTGAVNPGGAPPQFINLTTTTSSGTVSLGAGTTTLLAAVTLDTTGILGPATWDLIINNTVNGPTAYNLLGGGILPASLSDGSILVVPEPQSAALVSTLLLLAWGCWRYRCNGCRSSKETEKGS